MCILERVTALKKVNLSYFRSHYDMRNVNMVFTFPKQIMSSRYIKEQESRQHQKLENKNGLKGAQSQLGTIRSSLYPQWEHGTVNAFFNLDELDIYFLLTMMWCLQWSTQSAFNLGQVLTIQRCIDHTCALCDSIKTSVGADIKFCVQNVCPKCNILSYHMV